MVKSLNTYFAFGNCLFGAVELSKNAGPDKYKYSRYSIGFDYRLIFSWTDESKGKTSLFLEMILAHLCILIMKIKISQYLVKDQHKD